jgi:hypothetical protein
MKKILFTVILSMFFYTAFCQDIDFKKGIVLIDGKECIKMSREDNVSISFTDMEGNDLVFLRFIHDSKYAKLYNKITFPGQKLSLTSQSYIYTKKMLIKKLIKDKVIQDCKINLENLEKFILKYDENVEH